MRARDGATEEGKSVWGALPDALLKTDNPIGYQLTTPGRMLGALHVACALNDNMYNTCRAYKEWLARPTTRVELGGIWSN
jgi:hypothetical protein